SPRSDRFTDYDSTESQKGNARPNMSDTQTEPPIVEGDSSSKPQSQPSHGHDKDEHDTIQTYEELVEELEYASPEREEEILAHLTTMASWIKQWQTDQRKSSLRTRAGTAKPHRRSDSDGRINPSTLTKGKGVSKGTPPR